MKKLLFCLLFTSPVLAESLVEQAERIRAKDAPRSMRLIERAILEARRSGDRVASAEVAARGPSPRRRPKRW